MAGSSGWVMRASYLLPPDLQPPPEPLRPPSRAFDRLQSFLPPPELAVASRACLPLPPDLATASRACYLFPRDRASGASCRIPVCPLDLHTSTPTCPPDLQTSRPYLHNFHTSKSPDLCG